MGRLGQVVAAAACALAIAVPAGAAGGDARALQDAFTKVAERVGPAVVTIAMERTGKLVFVPGKPFYFQQFGRQGQSQQNPFEEYLKSFFGDLPYREFKQQGLGSGFIVDAEGHVLTNQHVIERADKITVILPDGRQFAGRLIGEDRRSDIAVLKVDAPDLPYAPLGDSETIETGQWAIAIGNPFGNIVKSPQPTVTVGVISALHRSLPILGEPTERNYMNLLQTDAAINPGNSGGPLCDIDGKVIGINVAIFSQSGGNIGLGFAIPVNTAKRVLDAVLAGKRVVYGWLGISMQAVSPDIAAYFKVPTPEGAMVVDIVNASPAAKAGLKRGDIIRTYNGTPLRDPNDLFEKVNSSAIGQTVKLGIIRDGASRTVTATVEERGREEDEIGKPAAKEAEAPAPKGKQPVFWRGIRVSAVTDALAARLNLTDRTGAVIVEMVPGSPTFKAGLRPGDVVREINRKAVATEADYRAAIAGAKGSVLIRADKGYFIVKEE